MILLSGENTPLASYLLPLLRGENQVCSFDSDKGSLTDERFLRSVFDEIRPALCINCDEVGDYTEAEIHREKAYALHGFGPGTLAQVCRDYDVMLIHISTTAVYRHDSPDARNEDAPVEPLSVYADSKLLGEKMIQESGCRYCILRLTDTFGRNDFMLSGPYRNALSNERITIIRNRQIMPLYAGDAARAVIQVYAQGVTGVYNLSGVEQMSFYEFLFRFFDMLQAETHMDIAPDVVEIDYERYLYPVDLPPHNCADSSMLHSSIDFPMPSADDALRRYIQEIADV